MQVLASNRLWWQEVISHGCNVVGYENTLSRGESLDVSELQIEPGG